jgi:hypothetical protein
MSGLLYRKRVFAAKVETTVGTAESLTGSEASFNAENFSIQPNVPVTRRQGQGGFNYLPGIPEGMQGTCTVRFGMSYNGTTLPTWASVLMPACGWVATGLVLSPVTQGPGGAGGVKTLTIGEYKDGKLSVLSGAMGSWKIIAETGKQAVIEFTFTGKYSTNETDEAILSPTYPTVLPVRVANGALTFNSVALCTSMVEFDSGNNVTMRECVNASDRSGFISAIVTDRAPVITANPESVLVATQDRDALWLTSSAQAFSMQIGATGNSITIAAPKAQIENKQQADRNGIMADDLTFLCTAGSAVDTELTITFD